MENTSKPILKSGELRADLKTSTVFYTDTRLALSHQNLQLLLLLLERAPEPVSHDELVMAIWGHENVSDESLKQRIRRLRQALGDAKNAIVNERGVGYRWRDPVLREEIEDDELKVPSRSAVDAQKQYSLQRLLSDKRMLLVVALVLSVMGGTLVVNLLTKESVPPCGSGRTTEESIKVGNFCTQADKYYKRFTEADNQTAIEIWDKANRDYPAYPCPYAGLAKGYAKAHLEYGAPAEQAQKALLLADKAIQIGPTRPDGYLAKGLAYHALGQLSLALNMYQQSAGIQPLWNLPVSKAAKIHEQMGNLAQAYLSNVEAVSKNPQDPIPWQELGNAFAILGLQQNSDEAFARAIEFKPDYYLARVNKARAALLTNQPLSALQQAREVLKEIPDFLLAWQVAADAALFSNDMKLAVKYYRSLLQQPSSLSVYAQVRLVLLDNQPFPELEVRLQGLLRAQPEVREWSYYLALLYAKKGKSEAALQYLEDAFEKGWVFWTVTQQEPAFRHLINDERFVLVVAAMKDKAQLARKEVEKLISK